MHGAWCLGGSWEWDGQASTKRIMETLVRRKVAVTDAGTYKPANGVAQALEAKPKP